MKYGLNEIRTNRQGFEAISELWANLSEAIFEDVHIDCSKMYWFDAHMAAPLMTIIQKVRKNGNSVDFQNLKASQRIILQKNGLLEQRIPDTHGTTIELQRFNLDQHSRFSKYMNDNLRRAEMPKMSNNLENKFFEGIHETFVNSVLHSKTETPIAACGQFYPTKERLDFVISDGGMGIARTVEVELGLGLNDVDAIEWAVKKGNTTRTLDVPGGLGLDIVREFLMLNGGRLAIVSGCGYWCQTKDGIQKYTIEFPFPGTAVLLEINTADNQTYGLDDVIDPDDIF